MTKWLSLISVDNFPQFYDNRLNTDKTITLSINEFRIKSHLCKVANCVHTIYQIRNAQRQLSNNNCVDFS